MDQVVYSNKGELQGEEDGDVDARCLTYIIIYLIYYCYIASWVNYIFFFSVHIYCILKLLLAYVPISMILTYAVDSYLVAQAISIIIKNEDRCIILSYTQQTCPLE